MSATRWAVILTLVLAAAAGGWWYRNRAMPAAPVVPPAPPPVLADPPPAAAADFPVPEPAPEAPPLPELADSDPAFSAALLALPGGALLERWLIPEMLIRRIVVTIDNLPGDRVALKLRPLKGVGGDFDADGGDGDWRIGAANPARYDAAVALLQAIDEQALVALYFRWYPRFEQAYRDLGYPDRRFNNRVVAVLDHLIGTPEVAEPIALVKPRVHWEYADPALESASAGRRLLWRIGAAHRTAVKAKLIAIRGRIVAGGV